MGLHTFNGLEVDVPDDWQDQTIITFISPPEAVHAAPLTGQKPDSHRASIVIKKIVLTEPMTAQDMAEAYEHIHVHASGGKVVNRGVIELDGSQASTRAYEVEGPEGTMRQLHVHLELGDEAFVIFGTAPADLNFKKLEKICTRAAHSLRRSA